MIARISLFILSLSVGFIILSKTLIYPQCFSYDNHDDANHAFPNLHVSRQAILAGELPTINFFNNFGSPILGDALTYPFAMHSLTYWFFESHIAMTINRIFFTSLTIYLGYVFYRKYFHLAKK